MKAIDIIEAESPHRVFQQAHHTKRTYQPRRLTPREIERLSNIIAMGPITKRPIDDRFLEWGYIEYYDNDEHDAVVAKQDFAAAFYNHPEIRGAYGDEWSDAPHFQRGAVRRYEAESPKQFLRSVAPRQGEALTVSSSQGTFDIDGSSGRVIRWRASDPHDADAQALENIDRFDLHEWRRYWQWKEKELPGGFDILDLGFWTKNGAYEQPEDDWREEMKRMGEGRVANPE